jgi:hypothetical protein
MEPGVPLSAESLDAALASFGLAYMPHIAEEVPRGREDWRVFPADSTSLYYPSRRQSSPAFNMLVDALRYCSECGVRHSMDTAAIERRFCSLCSQNVAHHYSIRRVWACSGYTAALAGVAGG